MKKPMKKEKPLWDQNKNLITGWKPVKLRVSTNCIEGLTPVPEKPVTFKPKGFH